MFLKQKQLSLKQEKNKTKGYRLNQKKKCLFSRCHFNSNS